MGCSASSAVEPSKTKPTRPQPQRSDEPTPKRPRLRVITENDLVWQGKKKLIPDLGVFKEIDQRAISAPENIRTKPAELVKYLIAPCKTELERFRAVFRWVASHIDYDVEFLNTGRPGVYKVEDCLASGKAICEGYSGVVKELCSHADVIMEKVAGCTKGGSYKVGDTEEFKISNGLPTHSDHAWVMVTINKQKFLCDPTWAAGKTSSSGGKKVYNREWDESFFLSDPEAFFEEHWPMGDNGESLYDKQLLKSPNKNFKDWLERPHKSIVTRDLGVTLTSHKAGLIEINESEVNIEFTSKFKLQHYVNMETLRGNAWLKIDKMTLRYREGDKYKVRVRLPYGKAAFIVQIGANLLDAEPELAERSLSIASYKVICRGEGNPKSYHPDFCERAGIEPDADNLGFQLESPKSPMIVAKGKEAVTITMPNSDPISLSARFYRLSDNAMLDEQVYLERSKNKIICHLRMYQPGEHALILFGDIKQTGSSSLSMLGNFLLNCTSPLSSELPPYCKSQNVHGPNKDFISLGLKDLSGESSIKRAEKGGKCNIKFKVPSGVTFWPILEDARGNQLPNERSCGVLDGDILTVMLKLPKTGNYSLGLYRKGKGTSLEPLAHYMIENEDPFQGELFPTLHEIIGPLPTAAENGLNPLDPNMKYHIKTSKLQHEVKFVANSNLDSFAILKSKGNKQDYIDCDVKNEDGKYVMTYNIKMTSPGLYSFMIWKNGSPTKQLVGMLVESG